MTELITPLSSAVMALVWVVYFHLFFRQYKRQNRPFLVIHHAQGHDPQAACMLVNMSEQPVHVQCVTAHVKTRDRSYTLSVTNTNRLAPEDGNITEIVRQGPLKPSGHLVLGSFEEVILGKRSEEGGEEDIAASLAEVESLELNVAVLHGPSRFPIGARRLFYFEEEDGATRVRPANIHTEQLVTRRRAKVVRKWVEEYVEPKRAGRSETQRSRQTEEQS